MATAFQPLERLFPLHCLAAAFAGVLVEGILGQPCHRAGRCLHFLDLVKPPYFPGTCINPQLGIHVHIR